ncbi:hypothetical protein BHE97_12850 [Aeromicrobium sp. PE09-221]|uniref:DUF6114 domain-containing protein n=1 Tax=Aeromicrobium sp. PE09-221 TaxID=1898043 RepID=UPI000B3E7BF4|nr:DUF6114 domain-containing protein [Aeromicrobium sp. PE09-221]OUZ08562.1 hypothetical protein BHE97_12850 [Aeromicrobium sp. PE09-221]
MSTSQKPNLFVRAWRGITRWRRTRPFWGSLALLAGAYFVANPLFGAEWAFYVHMGVRGMTPLLLAGGMAAAALVALCAPAQRHFPAIVASMFSVASLPLANLGGWIIGMMFGIIGSGLIFAWTPYSEKQLAKFAAREERRGRRRALRTSAA